jgi:hypothetical protein
MTVKTVFETLSVVNVGANVKTKGRFNYLSWVWAWTEVKKKYPDMNSTVYENADGWNYHHDGKTAWVKVGVTINGLEHIEYYPVTNNSNQPIAITKINSFDVNTAIQRAITKSIARFGLGLNVYAGEDLPLSEDDFLTDEQIAEQDQAYNNEIDTYVANIKELVSNDDEAGVGQLKSELDNGQRIAVGKSLTPEEISYLKKVV